MAELVDGWMNLRELAHESPGGWALIEVWECAWTDPDGVRETYRAISLGEAGEREAYERARVVLQRPEEQRGSEVAVRSREVVITPGAWISQGATLEVVAQELERLTSRG
jgi:hypothetical protein